MQAERPKWERMNEANRANRDAAEVRAAQAAAAKRRSYGAALAQGGRGKGKRGEAEGERVIEARQRRPPVVAKDDARRRDVVVVDGNEPDLSSLDATLGQDPVEERKRTTQAASQSQAPNQVAPSAGRSVISSSTSSALVQNLGKQVERLTSENESSRATLRKKDFFINELKRQNAALRSSVEHENLVRVTSERDALLRQVKEMEAFLRDYGLQWIGRRDDEEEDMYLGTGPLPSARRKDDSAAAAPEAAAAGAVDDDEFAFNLSKVVENVRELNMLAGSESKGFVSVDGGVRRLAPPSFVRVAVYKNGIVLDSKWHPYTSPFAQEFMLDLQDGFFPTHFKDSHPDGVPLSLELHETKMGGESAVATFAGEGRSLGGGDAAGKSRLLRTGGLDQSTVVDDEPAAADNGAAAVADTGAAGASSKASRLLKTGALPPRQDAAGTGEPKGAVDEAETPVKAPAGKGGRIVVRTHVDDLLADVDAAPAIAFSTLQVRSEDGATRFVLRLLADDTVSTLRYYLDSSRSTSGVLDLGMAQGGRGAYTLRSMHPPRDLNDDDSVESAGLMPTASLVMRA